MEDFEVIFAEDNKEGLPGIKRIGNTFYMTKCSIPQFASMDYLPFFNVVQEVISSQKNIVIDFKLGYYNSASNQVIRKLFDIISFSSQHCKPFVNWYYYEKDESMLEKGEILKEQNPKINFNIIEFKD